MENFQVLFPVQYHARVRDRTGSVHAPGFQDGEVIG
jgi:hypothetical protein